MNKKTKTIIWIIAGIFIVGLLLFLFTDIFGGSTMISASEFITKLKNNEIKSFTANAFVWEAIGTDDKVYTIYMPSVHYYADWAAFVEKVGEDTLANVKYELTNPNASSILDYIFPILSIGIGLILVFTMFRQMSGTRDHTMGIGKSKAHVQNNLKVRFSDVAGAEEEKEELKEVVEFLKSPKKFSDLGAKIRARVKLCLQRR